MLTDEDDGADRPRSSHAADRVRSTMRRAQPSDTSSNAAPSDPGECRGRSAGRPDGVRRPGRKSREAVIRPYALALLLIAIARVAAAQEAPPPVETDGRAFFAEPTLLTSIIDQAIRFHLTDDGDEDEGFYPKVGGMISGAGWISLGPGYRRNFFDGRARGDVHATVSWRAYLLGNATFEFPLLASGHLAA